MAQPRGARATRRDAKVARALILDATEAVVASEGVGAATFVRVAEEAGVSSGLIHYYFHTRDRLLREVVRRDAGQRLVGVPQPRFAGRLAEADSTDEIVRILGKTFTSTVAESPLFFSLLFELAAESRRTSEIRTALVEMFDEAGARLAPILMDKQAEGIVNLVHPALPTVRVLWALANGSAVQAPNAPPGAYRSLKQAALAAVRHLLTAGPDARVRVPALKRSPIRTDEIETLKFVEEGPRRELVRAAREIIVADGARKATFERVGELAGLSRGHVYYHYRTRARLLVESLRGEMEYRADTLATAIEDATSPAEIAMPLAAEARRVVVEQPNFFIILFELLSEAKRDPDLQALLTATLAGSIDRIGSALAVQHRRLPLNLPCAPRAAAAALYALSEGFALQVVLDPESDHRQTFAAANAAAAFLVGAAPAVPSS